MILLDTIQNRLLKVCENPNTFRFDFDVRYLGRWIKKYPSVFPKFILKGNYEPQIKWLKNGEFRWEIHKI